MKSLVIAEKPSVARDIARVLHCSQKGNGTLEGKDYVVTWALGHLVTLADPEEYDKKYTKWELSTLPMMPEKMKLVVIRQTSKQYNAVKTQLYRKDIGEIIIATDAGRELKEDNINVSNGYGRGDNYRRNSACIAKSRNSKNIC